MQQYLTRWQHVGIDDIDVDVGAVGPILFDNDFLSEQVECRVDTSDPLPDTLPLFLCHALLGGAALEDLYNTMQCNAVQCSAVQCNAMQYNTDRVIY